MATYTRELSPHELAAFKARWFCTVVENDGFSDEQVHSATLELRDLLNDALADEKPHILVERQKAESSDDTGSGSITRRMIELGDLPEGADGRLEGDPFRAKTQTVEPKPATVKRPGRPKKSE